MTSKVITVLILVFLGAALIGAVVYDSMTKKAIQEAAFHLTANPVPEQQATPARNEGDSSEIVLPPASGNIDEAVSSFLQEVDSESNLLLEENSDTGFVTSDSEVLGNIGQSSDDNTL
jgi:hypothetical protein